MKKLFIFLLLIPMIVNAEERTYTHENTSIFINENATTKLSDNNYSTYITLNSEDTITIENTEVIIVIRLKYILLFMKILEIFIK